MWFLACWASVVAAYSLPANSADEVLLVQHSLLRQRQEPDLQHMALHKDSGEVWPVAASWSAGPYGPCVSTCSPSVKSRNVECKSFLGKTLPDEMCTPAGKPGSEKRCSCELEVCSNETMDCASVDDEVPPLDPQGHEVLGCFELSPGDNLTSGGCENGTIFVDTCLNWTGAGQCRSGMPFYSNCQAKDSASCSALCWKKGLDVSGVVEGKECRCGASRLNAQVWAELQPPEKLLFKIDVLTPEPSLKDCPLLVSHYSGYYEAGGIPVSLKKVNLLDEAYVDGIVASHPIPEEQEEDLQGDDTGVETETGKGSTQDGAQKQNETLQLPMWQRSCFPDNCGAGRGPWPTRQMQKPQGVTGTFNEYVIIPYVFSTGLDALRKDAFRTAVENWHSATCLVMVEQAVATTSAYVQVGVADPNSCYVTGLGYGYIFVNLGSCRDLAHFGNMVHEIGHVLGMNHEMKRADAQATYHGKGPFLNMHWQNIAPSWVSQWLPDGGSYVGSANDGAGDPHIGYADYDFSSIMHYAPGDRFDTIPDSSKGIVGQRFFLSSGDINQVLDMYQCRTVLRDVATTTAAPVVARKIVVSGTCPESPSLDGEYTEVGVTVGGAPYFQSADGNMWIYWDPSCNGRTSLARWIVDNTQPFPSVNTDLDMDSGCTYYSRYYSQDTSSPPMGTNTWRVWCNSWSDVSLTFTDATPTTTSTTVTTTTVTTTTTTTTTITTTTVTTIVTTTTTTTITITTTLPPTTTTVTTPTTTTTTAVPTTTTVPTTTAPPTTTTVTTTTPDKNYDEVTSGSTTPAADYGSGSGSGSGSGLPTEAWVGIGAGIAALLCCGLAAMQAQ